MDLLGRLLEGSSVTHGASLLPSCFLLQSACKLYVMVRALQTRAVRRPCRWRSYIGRWVHENESPHTCSDFLLTHFHLRGKQTFILFNSLFGAVFCVQLNLNSTDTNLNPLILQGKNLRSGKQSDWKKIAQ